MHLANVLNFLGINLWLTELMLPRPDQKTIDTIKHAANLLSGAARRAFQAQTVLDHCNGNLSHAKTLFGWHQETCRRALLEKETDAIFENVKAAHKRSDRNTKILRLSIDTKAMVKLGEFSRGGKLRCFEPIQALEHDMEASGILVPFGILEVKQKQFHVVYGNSIETSDFIVDGLDYWWRYNKRRYPNFFC